MILTKLIELELDRITVEEDPATYKGKYACYRFGMSYPSEYHFFGNKKGLGDKPFTIVWGNSPSISYYSKDYKPLQKMVMKLIQEDLKFEEGWEIENWQIRFTGSSTPNDRDWGIYYHAGKWVAHCEWRKKAGHILLDKNFMARLIADLPEKVE